MMMVVVMLMMVGHGHHPTAEAGFRVLRIQT